MLHSLVFSMCRQCSLMKYVLLPLCKATLAGGFKILSDIGRGSNKNSVYVEFSSLGIETININFDLL